ncbi:MAG: DUF1697 domain-containing protein [Pyrinomonadaceae bacterium]|nr:DUF1697 domain-containing protein [Blastocatellia bacterium]MCW5956542.1 DUF1697 domain-containing protein [Pyrinomonadaceae bacterium]
MRYVALLRGINVGGNTMIKMAELKKSFESLGLENVVTYVNSGNLAFDSKKTAEKTLVRKLEGVIDKDFGKQLPVMVREQKEIPKIIAANPYAGEFESHKEMHVLFLREDIPKDKMQQLLDAAPDGERYYAIGRELYCHLPNGVIDSLLGRSFVEKKLKLAVTGRNWRTVEKLAEL